MDEDIQAAHRVEGAAQAFQVTGEEVEFGHVEAGLAGPAFRFLGHRFGDVAGADRACAHRRQGQAETPHTAPGVTEAHVAEFAAVFDPGQHFIHGFLMADADVALHLVHVVGFAVDAIPAIEASGFEIPLHLLLLGQLVLQLLFRGHWLGGASAGS